MVSFDATHEGFASQKALSSSPELSKGGSLEKQKTMVSKGKEINDKILKMQRTLEMG